MATIRQPLLLIDERMRVVSANASFQETFALPAVDLRERMLTSLPGLVWRDPTLHDLLAQLTSGSNEAAEGRLAPQLPADRHLHVVARRLQHPDEQVRLILLAFDDVTEQEARHAELTRSNRELDEFAAVASHDLQEPLRKIQAFATLLQARAGHQLDVTSRDYLDRIIRSATRLSGMIRGLLAVARTGTAPLAATRVDLNAVVTAALNDLGSAVSEAGATVHVARLPSVDGDRVQLQQVFQNLISNAVKFRRADVPLEIVISAAASPADATWAEIAIADNGIGIAPEDVSHVFEMFKRAARSAAASTGIGLALCQRIVARHGGDIRVESEVGRGTRFIIRVPIHQ